MVRIMIGVVAMVKVVVMRMVIEAISPTAIEVNASVEVVMAAVKMALMSL